MKVLFFTGRCALSLLLTVLGVQHQCTHSLASSSSSPSSSTPRKRPEPHIWPKLVVGGKEDPALGFIEQHQTTLQTPYGKFLDAGTGSYSLRWLAGLLYRHSSPTSDKLYMSSYVAVTADQVMRRNVLEEAKELGIDEMGEVIIGNWAAGYKYDTTIPLVNNNNEKYLCEGELFDTILADYLLGAVDHFAPFFQDLLFTRIVQHLKPNTGRLYITGLQPIPEKVEVLDDDDDDDDANKLKAANLFCQITKLRDSCILLAGSRPYREHPLSWVLRNLPKSNLQVLDYATFPKTYDFEKMKIQLDEARSTLRFMKDENVKSTMSVHIDALEKELKKVCEQIPNGEFAFGFDYVVICKLQQSEKDS